MSQAMDNHQAIIHYVHSAIDGSKFQLALTLLLQEREQLKKQLSEENMEATTEKLITVNKLISNVQQNIVIVPRKHSIGQVLNHYIGYQPLQFSNNVDRIVQSSRTVRQELRCNFLDSFFSSFVSYIQDWLFPFIVLFCFANEMWYIPFNIFLALSLREIILSVFKTPEVPEYLPIGIFGEFPRKAYNGDEFVCDQHVLLACFMFSIVHSFLGLFFATLSMVMVCLSKVYIGVTNTAGMISAIVLYLLVVYQCNAGQVMVDKKMVEYIILNGLGVLVTFGLNDLPVQAACRQNLFSLQGVIFAVSCMHLINGDSIGFSYIGLACGILELVFLPLVLYRFFPKAQPVYCNITATTVTRNDMQSGAIQVVASAVASYFVMMA